MIGSASSVDAELRCGAAPESCAATFVTLDPPSVSGAFRSSYWLTARHRCACDLSMSRIPQLRRRQQCLVDIP